MKLMTWSKNWLKKETEIQTFLCPLASTSFLACPCAIWFSKRTFKLFLQIWVIWKSFDPPSPSVIQKKRFTYILVKCVTKVTNTSSWLSDVIYRFSQNVKEITVSISNLIDQEQNFDLNCYRISFWLTFTIKILGI